MTGISPDPSSDPELEVLAELIQQTRDSLAAGRGDRPPIITPYAELPEKLKDANRQIAAAVRDRVLAAERDRAATADGAKLAEIRTIIGTFFQHYGHSELPMFRRAQDLAHGIRQVLDRDSNGSEGEGRG